MKAITAFLVFLSVILPVEVEPKTAAYLVTTATGRPDLADDLIAICWRESRCTPIGPHSGDSDLDPSDGWRGQINLGHLDKRCQPYRPDVWHTRGAWGLWASVHWRYMPPCYQPEWLDHPLVSAHVAIQKYVKCENNRNYKGWCKTPWKVRKNNIHKKKRRHRPR